MYQMTKVTKKSFFSQDLIKNSQISSSLRMQGFFKLKVFFAYRAPPWGPAGNTKTVTEEDTVKL